MKGGERGREYVERRESWGKRKAENQVGRGNVYYFSKSLVRSVQGGGCKDDRSPSAKKKGK